MTDTPFKSSSDAYRHIHRALGVWVQVMVDEAGDGLLETVKEAMALAALMREIEEHTDVD